MSVFHLENLTDAQVEELAEAILEIRDPEKAIAFWHFIGKQASDVVLRLQKHNVGLYIAALITAKKFYEEEPPPTEDAIFFNKLYGWPLTGNH